VKERSKAAELASILLQQHDRKYPENSAIDWRAAYALERLFGVHSDSPWKSVTEAVRHAAQAPSPSPFVVYDFDEHALHVRNGDLLTRGVKLCELEPNREG
jgi:hypothetical protein